MNNYNVRGNILLQHLFVSVRVNTCGRIPCIRMSKRAGGVGKKEKFECVQGTLANSNSTCIHDILTTDPEVPGSIPGATRLSEK
jgi:hypothetical protein